MFITFVIDTSGSMSQKSVNGMTLLDCCKVAIDHFIKIRSKDSSMRNDKFFLLTSEDVVLLQQQQQQQQQQQGFQSPPNITSPPTTQQQQQQQPQQQQTTTCVKVGWKESFPLFLQEVKNLSAKDMSNLSMSVQKSFDLLNQFRIPSSIDNYGQGRIPWYIDPGVVILITDGSSLSNLNNIMDNFTAPKNTAYTDLSNEPYRWDQRMFSMILRFSSIPTSLTLSPPTISNNTISISSSSSSSSSSGISSNINGFNISTGDYYLNNIPTSIGTICDNTGGKCQIVSNVKSMIQCIESIVQKLHHGVVVSFEPIINNATLSTSNNSSLISSPITTTTTTTTTTIATTTGNVPLTSPPIAASTTTAAAAVAPNTTTLYNISLPSLHKMIYVIKNGVYYWPIPENYYPDITNQNIPLRSAHPIIKYSLVESESYIPDNFPFDKYEIESCNITQTLIGMKLQCVQVYIQNSQQIQGQGDPFGFIKVQPNSNIVNLIVLPYNYPKLWSLLDELMNQLKSIPSQKWRQEFENYCLSIPPYYISPMRNAFKRYFPTLQLIPDNIDSQFLNYISNIVKKLKSQQPPLTATPTTTATTTTTTIPATSATTSLAATGAQSVNNSGSISPSKSLNLSSSLSSSSSPLLTFDSKKLNFMANSGGGGSSSSSSGSGISGKFKNFHQILESASSSSSSSADNEDFDSSSLAGGDSMDIDGSSTTSGSGGGGGGGGGTFINILNRNVFDIQRSNLLGQLDRMRDHIFKRKFDEDESKHHLPISIMGNFHDTIAKKESLRDIDEEKKPNLPLFGNPYRKEKGSSPRFNTMSIDEADINEISLNSPQGSFLDDLTKKSIQKRRRILSTKQQQQQQQQELLSSKDKQQQQQQQKPPQAIPLSPPSSIPVIPNAINNIPIQHPQQQDKLNSSSVQNGTPLSTSLGSITSSTLKSLVYQQQQQIINENNIEISKFVNREIRRPTKNNYDVIIENLKQVTGCDDSKLLIYIDSLKLAKEYKKTLLVLQINNLIQP